MKGNKGITLIALVITIIVLLILAAVSIAMLTGDNSIFSRAKESSYANALGAAKDEVSIKVTDLVADYYKAVYVNNTPVSTTNYDSVDNYIKSKLTNTLETDNVTMTGANSDSYTLTYTLDTSHKVTGNLSNGKIQWQPVQ